VHTLKAKVNKYGPMPTNMREFEELSRRLLTEVYQTLNRDFERGVGGADIQKCFERFRKTLAEIKDPFIDQDVLERKNRGWNVPTGDLDNESFKEMIAAKVSESLEMHCTELVETVHEAMSQNIERAVATIMFGFDELRKAAGEQCVIPTTRAVLKEARQGVRNLMAMEKTYVYDPSQAILTLNADKVKQLNTYFDFVKTTLGSSVPKSIMYFYCYPLLYGLRDKLPFVLRNENRELSDEEFYKRLGSPSGDIATERAVASQQLAVLQEAWDDLRLWQSKN